MKKNNFIISALIMTFLFSYSVQAVTSHDISFTQSSNNVAWGQNTILSFRLTCYNSIYDCRCQVSCNGGTYQSIGNIIAGSSNTFSTCSYTAPTSGQGSVSYTVRTACNDAFDSTYDQKTQTATITYPTSQEWSTYQAEQQAKSQAESARNAASTAISSANSAINTAQSRINEAKTLGADVNTATQSLYTAQSDYTSANNLLSSGTNAYNSKSYSSATSYYNQAQSKAESASNNAANVKSSVDRIIEEYNRQKQLANTEVTKLGSAIDTAKMSIEKSDKIISDATILGLDTAQSKADVATARLNVDKANSYYKEASNAFSTGDYNNAVSKSQSGVTLADSADSLATTAYNRLNERVTVAGESSKSILSANTEVSQMNEILTKMDYIIRSTEKWGVNLAETKEVVATAKTNVDSAEDLLSQAKNRQTSGSFNDAVTFGNQARDKAAASRNRLDTMSQSISLSTQDALEKAITNLQTKLTDAETEVKSAQETYGSTPELVVDAQNDLASAKNLLQQAKNEISSVNSDTELLSMLQKAEQAFKTLDSTQEKIQSAVDNAKSAKMGLTKKLAIGGAAIAGAAGGGFLYYRIRKKKGNKTSKNDEEEEKDDKKSKKKDDKSEEENEEKISKKSKKEESSKENKKASFCSKCGNKLVGNEKFCNKCGQKTKGN